MTSIRFAPLIKLAPSIIWLIGIYVLTALAEDFTPPPDEFWARLLFELQHVAAHAFVYAVQTILLLAAIPAAARALLPRRDAHRLIGVILLLGLGQEALQTLMRADLTVLCSAFDLLVDTSSAALILWLHRRWQRRSLTILPRPSQALPTE